MLETYRFDRRVDVHRETLCGLVTIVMPRRGDEWWW
jgi:hypothetical protein